MIVFKTKAKSINPNEYGNHIHVTVFGAPYAGHTFANLGMMRMTENEYNQFIIDFKATHEIEPGVL